MSSNLDVAIRLLKSKNYTLAAVNGDREITSFQRGVKPLLELVDSGINLYGFSVADKVIGKAAALLYVLLCPAEIYTCVISKPALEVLKKYNINVRHERLAEAIRNRNNTGFCPMETAVRETDSPDKALILIQKTLLKISKKEN